LRYRGAVKILATFDESPFSEAILPILTMLAALPDVELDLCSVAEITAAFDDDAVSKRRQDLASYLNRIMSRLPAGPTCRVSTEVAMYPMDAATVLVERARSEHSDMIVMATHGRSGVVRMFVGSTADKVLQAGVAPVLLVHPTPES
jgi:nucleotide-binding universal stress UspA family protein